MRELDPLAVEQRLQTLLQEGSNVFVDYTKTEMTLPEFYDPVKFRRGQKVFHDNIFTMMIAKLCGLLLLFSIPSLLQVLKFTGQSGTPCAAFRRYASTILHTCIWYENSPEKDTKFFLSLNTVKKKHCIAWKRASEAGIGRISQLDMVLTQFGFMGFVILSAERLGIHATVEEFEGLLHLWRVIGKMLGTEDRFNLCNGSLEECKALCERLLEVAFMPGLAKATEDLNEMSDILLQSMWPVNPFITPGAFRYFTNRLVISSLPNNNHTLHTNYKSLSLTNKIIVNLQIGCHEYLLQVRYWWSSIFRAFFNSQMNIGIYLTEHFPFLAHYLFGRRESNFNIFSYAR